MKLSQTFLSFLFFGGSLVATLYVPDSLKECSVNRIIKEKLQDGNLEFAFDIHKVLVHRTAGTQLGILFHPPHVLLLSRAFCNFDLFKNLAGLAWQGIINIQPWYRDYYSEINSERLINLCRNAHEHELAQFLTRLVNTQHVDPEMMVLVQELVKNGYILRVASNIGSDIFDNLKSRLASMGQNIFDYFTKDTHNREGKTVNHRVSPVQKPDRAYFSEYQNTYDPEAKKLFIFIDDKLINVLAAVQMGFIGIHFKNCSQLRKELAALELL